LNPADIEEASMATLILELNGLTEWIAVHDAEVTNGY
jgi:hypothetical protein